MVRITKPTSNIEDGIYTLRIGESQTKTITDPKTGEQLERIEFTFKCLDGDSEGEEFKDLTSDLVGPRSKLGKIYRAALKTDAVPEDWDTADLEGERFSALVQTNDNGYPKIAIESIKPAKPKAAKAKAKPAPVEDDEDTWDDEDAA